MSGDVAGKPVRPSAVLYACTYNAVRSPMAAAITRRLFPGSVYARSAGVRKGDSDLFGLEVMEEAGYDISRHNPHSFQDLGDLGFDLIVTLTPEAHEKALEMTRTLAVDVEYWPTPDPTVTNGSRTQMLDAYRQVRDGLEAKIKQRLGWQPSPKT